MRVLVGLFGVVCSVAVIAGVAHFGYVTADGEAAGVIAAFLFGAIAAGGLGGHAVAVRIWRRNWVWALLIGVIAALALTVNLSNSLGAIVGRGDVKTAERLRLAQVVKDDRATLARITRERETLPAFVATSADAVAAARAALAAAEKIEAAECDRRGSKCRERENETQARRADLSAVLVGQTATMRAATLDVEIEKTRARLAAAKPVETINPQAAAFVALFRLPETATASASYYQGLAVSLIIELLIVAAFIAFELLRDERAQNAVVIDAVVASPAPLAVVAPPAPQATPLAAPIAPLPPGDVGQFLTDCLQPAGKAQVEVGDVYGAYHRWCRKRNAAALPVDVFGARLAAICGEVGIAMRAKGQKVYCVGVKVAA